MQEHLLCEEQKVEIIQNTVRVKSDLRFELINCVEEEIEELDLHFLKETVMLARQPKKLYKLKFQVGLSENI